MIAKIDIFISRGYHALEYGPATADMDEVNRLIRIRSEDRSTTL
jgi:hypothetical protein